jgi:anaerobic selenocysteine-containing dehydrogenase
MPVSQEISIECKQCIGHCGAIVTVEDGKAVKIRGDKTHPGSKGTMCKRGLASLEFIYHPDRLKKPLKRTGERGEGKFAEISWDEAFGIAGRALNKVREKDGPLAVFMAHGSAKGPIDTYLVRLANAFGTPNVVCSDHDCHVPKILASEYTFGYFPMPMIFERPACYVSWGAARSEQIPFMRNDLVRMIGEGTRYIVIDPMPTRLTGKESLWLRIKPGSDLPLALGMLNVIISENLYDREFVEKWTTGFEEVKKHVEPFTPAKVEFLTWIPSDQIIRAARMYATTKPAHIDWGNAVDQTINSFQTSRAISILMAITGNLGVPGGEPEAPDSSFRDSSEETGGIIHGRWSHDMELRHNISPEVRRRKVGAGLTALPDFRYTTPQAVIKSIIEKDPYQIKAGYIQSSNPLSCWPNISRVREAFNKLDFLAVTEIFMTPTAAMADIVFPAATYFEYDGVEISLECTDAFYQQKVASVGDCRSCHEIVHGLAGVMGLEKHFWPKVDGFWDAVLEPVGMKFDDLKKEGHCSVGPVKYHQYEKNGFKTPSGKVELYCQQLVGWGVDPLPTYLETPAECRAPSSRYPFVCTMRKPDIYNNSDGKQIPTLRQSYPDPVMQINPAIASKLGINDGDWALIESPAGKIKQKAKYCPDLDPRVIYTDNAWWYPEKGFRNLFGYDESNYNALTSDRPPFNKEIGSFIIRGVPCNVCRLPVS